MNNEALIHGIRQSIQNVAESIFPEAKSSHDAAGVCVSSLSEAVMGMTAALVLIADALENIAEAIAEKKQ